MREVGCAQACAAKAARRNAGVGLREEMQGKAALRNARVGLRANVRWAGCTQRCRR